MLLSPAAIADAAEVCSADDFYKPAHGHIFDAITSLYGRGEPADPVTVADELHRADLLDAIGGPAELLALQANTPAISNAPRYARIVEEMALLRRLIGVAGEIAELGYDVPEDVATVVDRAETLVFEVAQRRITDTLRPLHDLLSASLDRLETLFEQGESITGVPTGFIDLDERLSGLQPSNLIVVGARPGAGKTSFALGVVAHAAMEAHTPVLLFSLEMSHEEITRRLLSGEARVDARRLQNGRLQEQDWPKISHAIGRLGEAPVFIDDNPNITVMDIRTKARRLKSREGLGLIVIDYLQLMSGRSNAENRQVEVSEMSRKLKILARELEVPVVALSQLSRQVEMRADKRPVLADLRESGCVTADTRVQRADTGAEVTIGELLLTEERDIPVWSLDEHLKVVPATMTHVFPSGIKEVFELRLASGRTIKASANHPFLTVHGWTRLDELEAGKRVAVPRTIPAPAQSSAMSEPEIVMLAHLIGDGCVASRQPVHYTSADPANLEAVEAAAAHFGITPRRVSQGAWTHVYLPAPYRLTHGRRNPIQRWLEQFGLDGLRSYEKFIPRQVFSLANEQLGLFLRHLWATDGCVHLSKTARRPRIYYATSSEALARGVQALLVRFEIRSRVRAVRSRRGRTQYHVVISGRDDQLTFVDTIGVNGARGAVAAEIGRVLRTRTSNTNVDTIPREVWWQVGERLAERQMTTREFATAMGTAYAGSAHFAFAPSRPHLTRVAEALADGDLAELAASDVYWDRIVSIESLGSQPVYDATVQGLHNFIANGMVIHNSIEQDADVVMFIYRDELYNPESADRGTAEIIVAKHRNGPTGTVSLAFLDQYTRFANMARN